MTTQHRELIAAVGDADLAEAVEALKHYPSAAVRWVAADLAYEAATRRGEVVPKPAPLELDAHELPRELAVLAGLRDAWLDAGVARNHRGLVALAGIAEAAHALIAGQAPGVPVAATLH